jgi:NAD(P)-dependent dehydrogenase (short-subunit alcohol dehydrogenase family)
MSEQVTIVTGGGGNIGRGLCRALANAGALPIAVDLDPSAADAAARQITSDLRDPGACAETVDEVVREFGRIDTLINAAQGIRIEIPLLRVTDDDMRFSFESGPIATLRMMQLCHPHLKARGGGAIINFASGVGTQGREGGGAYAAAKEAIRGLTKTAALEWGPDNIRVNAVCPLASGDPDAWWIADALPGVPLGRIGDPEKDIGTLILYLASPDCYMTGRTLQIDGGTGTWR